MRRFALAMRAWRVPGDRELWVVGTQDGSRVPVLVASTPLERWCGIAVAPPGCGVVLRTRSVHTFGMASDLLVVAIDEAGRVLSSSAVAPRRFHTIAAATWMVELPVATPFPAVGAELALLRRILVR